MNYIEGQMTKKSGICLKYFLDQCRVWYWQWFSDHNSWQVSPVKTHSQHIPHHHHLQDSPPLHHWTFHEHLETKVNKISVSTTIYAEQVAEHRLLVRMTGSVACIHNLTIFYSNSWTASCDTGKNYKNYSIFTAQ